MPHRDITLRLLLISPVLLLLLLPQFGCTSAEEERAKEQEGSTIRQLAPLLGSYIGANRGQYPKSEEDFRKFLEQMGKNPDELLINNRDGKPIKIVTQSERAKVKGSILAYEQEGKDGERIVIDDLGVATVMTEEEFRQAVPQG